MIGTGLKVVAGLLCAALSALLLAGGTFAQGGKWSDASVRCMMNYAWTLTPPTFTSPSGRKIVVDKTKKKDVMVPIEAAREVVRVARISAFAEVCNLPEDQVANYQTLMRREEASAKWSDQQLLYMSQLHTTTLMLLTGKLGLIDKDTGKQAAGPDEPIELCEGVQIRPRKVPQTSSCSEGEREKVRKLIKAYIDSPPAADAAPKGPPTKTGSTPKK